MDLAWYTPVGLTAIYIDKKWFTSFREAKAYYDATHYPVKAIDFTEYLLSLQVVNKAKDILTSFKQDGNTITVQQLGKAINDRDPEWDIVNFHQ